MLSLRSMTEPDLLLVAGWLGQPHVARWWGDTTVEAQLAKYRDRIRLGSRSATHMLTVLTDDTPVGWCQWYRWADFPAEAEALGTLPGEVGLDYALGDPASAGHGAGTQLIAALVTEVRRHHPAAGFLVDPDAGNTASCRVLEKNGFRLLAVRPVATEPGGHPMAFYRLFPPEEIRMSTPQVAAPQLAGITLAPPGSQLVLAEWTAPGSTGDEPLYQAPLHAHPEDEAWYVLEGTLAVRAGEQVHQVTAGGAVIVPGGSAHTFWNPSPDPVRYLLVMGARTLALIRDSHAAADRDPERMRQLYAAHGAVLLE